MIDLTKIEKPFGLLDAETQQALRVSGGPFQVYNSPGVWRDLSENGVSFFRDTVYRVKPTPPKPRECWSYGAHIRDTEAEALAFRHAVAADYPGRGYEALPITKWIEVLE